MDTSHWLDWYRQMVVIRRLEEKAAEFYQLGKIGGFLHLYIGQEAVSTGLISARQPQDRVITAYRDHGVAINCGMEAKVVLAELLGKATGCSKGKGGSMHLAKVWDLPVLFVCENNLYGMGTSLDRASAVTQMRQKAEGYNIPNGRVEDGMDILAVHEAAAQAIGKVRAPGHGPYFLEIITYRFRGHSMGDPERYRKAEEVKK